MSRLDDIAERDRLGITRLVTEYRTDWDRKWLLDKIRAALAYIDKMLGDEPNSQQLAYLRRTERILTGLDDGRPANDTGDTK